MEVGHQIISEPQIYPISIDLAATHLRIDSPYDIEYVENYLIPTSTNIVQDYLNRSLITQTHSWTVSLSDFYDYSSYRYFPFYVIRTHNTDTIKLGHGRVQSIESVKFFNRNGDESVLVAGTDYTANLAIEPAKIYLTNRNSKWEFVTCTYVAGYGNSASDVPLPIRQAILLVITQLYKNRGDTSLNGIDLATKSLLNKYRLMVFE